MHTNSTYPSLVEDINLSCINTLKNKFNCKVGYSGHESHVSPSVAAWVLGANYIERHITLDRSMWGSDHVASVEPIGVWKLVKGVRDVEKSLGEESSFYAGIAGSLLFTIAGGVEPGTFNLLYSIIFIAIVIIGGAGTVLGLSLIHI